VKLQDVARELRGVANGGCGGRMVRPPAKACRCKFRPKGGLPPASGLQDAHALSESVKAADVPTQQPSHLGEATLKDRSHCQLRHVAGT
jgi:hypothetical protein